VLFSWILIFAHKKSGRNLPLLTLNGLGLSTDRRWFAQMALFHGHAATAIAYKFHCCQFILAHMFGIRIGCAAKAAFCIITTGAAQMPWFVSDGTARFACIGHYGPPLNRLTASLAEHEYSEGKSQEMRPIPPG
jgi:hypothetical protein